MATRTCLKLKNFKNTSVLNNRTSLFPGSQAFLRQATTSSTILQTLSSPFKFADRDLLLRQQDIHLVRFTSPEGKRLFRGAMVQGQAESFFKLMGNFSTQSSPSHGGVSSRKFIFIDCIYL